MLPKFGHRGQRHLAPARAYGGGTARSRRRGQVRRYWQLYLMLALPMAFLMVFNYWPMLGAQIAFRNYNPVQGMWHSPWVGLAEFRFFVQGPYFWPILSTTLFIGAYYLAVTIPATLILALALNELKHVRFKKVAQLVTYAPYFISVVVLVGMIQVVLSPTDSLFSNAAHLVGIQNPPNILANPNDFSSIYVWSAVWQESGYGAVIYLAALSGVSTTLYEAARLDGASRLQRIRHVDLPAIRPTIVVLFILGIGNILNVAFEKVYLLQNPLNLSKGEIISTYVYKTGLIQGNFSFAAAVGLFNSVVAFALLVLSNFIAKRLTGDGLF